MKVAHILLVNRIHPYVLDQPINTATTLLKKRSYSGYARVSELNLFSMLIECNISVEVLQILMEVCVLNFSLKCWESCLEKKSNLP